MNHPVCQGDILKIENIRCPVLVVSKDYFNLSGEIIGCPVLMQGTAGPLHILIQTETVSGWVQCEKISLLDLNVRRFSYLDCISMPARMNITDAIQGIFDYV